MERKPRNDARELETKFSLLGLTPHLPSLRLSHSTKEALMAFRPGLWGLQIWISGKDFTLLDERGFLCKVDQAHLALALVTFESTEGPGACGEVLGREGVPPSSGVRVLTSKFNPKAEVPAVAPEPVPRPLRRRKLSSSDFANLLKDL